MSTALLRFSKLTRKCLPQSRRFQRAALSATRCSSHCRTTINVRAFERKFFKRRRPPQLGVADLVLAMAEPTRPVSIRLAAREIERLQARAHLVSGSVAGVARELIVSGLADGDGKALAERLMQVERRLVALEGHAREVAARTTGVEDAIRTLSNKFDALLNALSSNEGAAQ
jgi:hypothetical protein